MGIPRSLAYLSGLPKRYPIKRTALRGPRERMSGVKQGFWERGATDQKTKRTNKYLSVATKVLLRRVTGLGGMTAYYAVNYDGNIL